MTIAPSRIVRTEGDRARLLDDVRAMPLDKPLRVEIRRIRQKRTPPQNSGYAVMIDEAAEALAPITGDDVKSIKSDLRDHVRYNFVPLKAQKIGRFPSTRHCSVEEMSEVMERFAKWMAEEWGIVLSPLIPARVMEHENG